MVDKWVNYLAALKKINSLFWLRFESHHFII